METIYALTRNKAGGKVSHLPPTQYAKKLTRSGLSFFLILSPFGALPHPPTTRRAGSRQGPGRLPPDGRGCQWAKTGNRHHDALGRFASRPSGSPCPKPRRGFRESLSPSSLDTNRNILTDSAKVAIVNYRRMNHDPPYRKAVGNAPNTFRDALSPVLPPAALRRGPPLKMGV